MKLNRTMLDMKALSILAGLGLSAGLPASDAVWKSAADGDWMTAANWVDGVMPSSTARACFTNDTAAYTVTLNATDPQTAQGLVISGQVTIATHATRLNVNSPLILDGGGNCRYVDDECIDNEYIAVPFQNFHLSESYYLSCLYYILIYT